MAERAHPDDEGFKYGWNFRLRRKCVPWASRNVLREALFKRYQWVAASCKNADVLDIPCGVGWGTSMLQGTHSLYGADVDEAAIDEARARYGDCAEFIVGGMENLPFENSQFDVIACLEGIEHVSEEVGSAFMREVSRVLRPGGLLFLSTPHCLTRAHSGNPYHLREYHPDEILGLLEPWFSVEERFSTKIDDIEITYLKLKVRQQAIHITQAIPSALRADPLPWVAKQESPVQPGRYRFSTAAQEYTLLSTCYASFIRTLFSNLHPIQPAQTAALVSLLIPHQNSETGFFQDPLLRASDLPRHGHNAAYITWQSTFFTMASLSTLGAEPLHPLSFLDAFLEENNPSSWLEAMDWSNPWLVTNPIMFTLSLLLQESGRRELPSALPFVHGSLDWLEYHQNPQTGFWDLGKGCSLQNAMAGAFHLYFFFLYLERPVNSPQAIIEHTLQLQAEDGLFDSRMGGGACIDLDAIDILIKFSLLTDYRAEDVRTALQHAYRGLWANQKADGSFCEAKRILPPKSWKRKTAEALRLDQILDRPWPHEVTVQAGWKKMRHKIHEGDLWSTWFRPLAMALISDRYPGEFLEDAPNGFMKVPSLGWHDRGKLDRLRKTIRFE